MLDIKFIAENKDLVLRGIARKNTKIPGNLSLEKFLDSLIELNNKFKKIQNEIQSLNQQANKASNERDFEKGKQIKEEKQEKQNELESLSSQILEISPDLKTNSFEDGFNQLLREIPQLPKDDVPDEDNEIKKVGEPAKFSFTPKDHLEIGEALDIIDVERAAKVSGSRFGYLKNEGALLEFALVKYALETLLKEGFNPVVPPVLIKKEITDKLGYWNGGGNEDYYLVVEPGDKENKTGEELFYLIGTAEHSIVPMHKDEVLNKKDLPLRYVGFSSAFRREAGTYGKDTRGILRVHQFDKVEMVSLTFNGEEDKEHEFLLEIEEKLFQGLGIPYHVLNINAKDLGFPISKKYDIEAWIPSQDKYREMTSVSTTGDFQSRRLNIKYQDGDQKRYVNILNGTGFAIGRTIIAILENYQEADGSVHVPEVLQKYMGGITKIERKAK